jgi:pimeloyl-ACP methyl ester carboxylesterase
MIDAILQIVVWLVLFSIMTLAGFALFTSRIATKVRRVIPPTGSVAHVEGGAIHFVEYGAFIAGKPSLVLIHGLSGNLHNFEYALSGALAKNYHVIVLDRPGCGYSRRQSSEQARLPVQARMINEFLEKQNIEKSLVVGHSLGGAVALAMALDSPQRVGGLALIAPLTSIQTKIPTVFRGFNVPNETLRRWMSYTVATPGSLQMGGKVAAEIFAPNPVPNDFSIKGGGLLTLLPDAFYSTSTDAHAVALDLETQQSRYSELNLPIGVLYGREDGVLDPATHIDGLMAACPDLQLTMLDNVGHMPIINAVDETLAFIEGQAARVSL